MRQALILFAIVGACHRGSAPVPKSRASAPAAASRPDRCDMVEAILAIENPGYQKIYSACGGRARSPRYVDVRAPASLLPPDMTCPGRAFTLYRGQADVDWLIVKLDLSADGRSWKFVATRYQPHPTVNEDGSLESVQSFCGAVGGFVEWTGERWRTFWDPDRAYKARTSAPP